MFRRFFSYLLHGDRAEEVLVRDPDSPHSSSVSYSAMGAPPPYTSVPIQEVAPASARAAEEKKDVHVVIVLDESESMKSNKSEIISAVNKFVANQQELKVSDGCDFTLVKFHSTIVPTLVRVKLAEVKPLKDADYTPQNMTALFDAVGWVFSEFSGTKNVVLVVVTDGHENSSRAHTRGSIKSMIEDHTKNHGWNVVYLAADPILLGQGESMGMSNAADNTSSCSSVPMQQFANYSSGPLSNAVSGYRSGATRTVNLRAHDPTIKAPGK
jgi:hypothetical protein